MSYRTRMCKYILPRAESKATICPSPSRFSQPRHNNFPIGCLWFMLPPAWPCQREPEFHLISSRVRFSRYYNITISRTPQILPMTSIITLKWIQIQRDCFSQDKHYSVPSFSTRFQPSSMEVGELERLPAYRASNGSPKKTNPIIYWDKKLNYFHLRRRSSTSCRPSNQFETSARAILQQGNEDEQLCVKLMNGFM